MWTYNYNTNELYHHGVKGMKWGVRRYQNPDGTLTKAGKKRLAKKQYGEMGKDKRKFEEEEYKRLYKEEDLDGERQKLIDFARKHNLDMDDGGGGSARAGAKYMDMWDKWEAHHESIQEAATQRASKRLIKKYGQESFDAMKDREERISKGMNAASAAIAIGIPVALLAAGAALVIADS